MIFRVGLGRGFLAVQQRGVYSVNRNPFHIPVGMASPGAFGMSGDFPAWQTVFKLYAEDNLVAAYAEAEPLGLGQQGDYTFFVTVLATEFEASKNTEIYTLEPGIEFEIDPARIPDESFDNLAAFIRSEIQATRQKLPKTEAPLLITCLPENPELPSIAFSDGYYTAKSEYGKLCIPFPATEDRAELGCRIRRGVAYHVGEQLTQDTADAWLLEALTVLTDSSDPTPRSETGYTNNELNNILEGARKEDDEAAWHQARAQAAHTGQALFAQKTSQEIGRMLEAHTEKGWADLLTNSNLTPTERALKKAWHLS